MCRVINIDLQENTVELSYEADGEDGLWTTITTEQFDRYAIAE